MKWNNRIVGNPIIIECDKFIKVIPERGYSDHVAVSSGNHLLPSSYLKTRFVALWMLPSNQPVNSDVLTLIKLC